MKLVPRLLGLLGAAALAGCSSTSQGPAQTGVAPAPAAQTGHTSTASSTPGSGVGRRYTEADISFMKGMIAHHAQAVLIAGWAPTHEASPSLKALCERIVVGQKDEIATMQNWLRDRGQEVPSADPTHHMAGMHHQMLMPGMLTDEQLEQLDRARGGEFDKLFLKDMIQHHQGALTMVKQLFGTPGAAQDDQVFKFASDMNADQTIEIERMNKMLAALP
jgi:uncharacterized protein (DUF305 family)